MEESKRLAEERGVKNWQEICLKELNKCPSKLPNKDIELMSKMYQTLANCINKGMGQEEVFPDSLEDLIQRMKR